MDAGEGDVLPSSMDSDGTNQNAEERPDERVIETITDRTHNG